MGKGTCSPSGVVTSLGLRKSLVLTFGLFVLAVAICSSPVLAEVFESAYLRFTLPEGWTCDLEGSEHVCEPPHTKGLKVGAIFILAGKYPGDSDSLPSYLEELKRNKSVTHGSSLVDGPKISKINGVSWVEATHYESELEGYYTIYEATISNGLAVLATFSVRKGEYAQFRDMVGPCIQSLQIKKDWRSKTKPPSR
jgi:hypothetical protein